MPEDLFRIIPVERLYSWFRDRSSALISPLLWEDPYEAAPLRVKLTHPLYRDVDGALKIGRKFIGDPVRAGTWSQGGEAIRLIFCQSWTATAETDTMWRAYSSDKKSVRVRVKTRNLLNAAGPALTEDRVYFGEVQYVGKSELDSQISDGKACYHLQRLRGDGQTISNAWIPAILRKRIEFHPEREFRLIYIFEGNSDQNYWRKVIPFPIDPFDLVEEVALDPRASSLAELQDGLRQLGYQGAVNRSSLYSVPEYAFWNSTHPR